MRCVAAAACAGYWRLEECCQQFCKTEDSTRDSVFRKCELLSTTYLLMFFCVSCVFSVPPTAFAFADEEPDYGEGQDCVRELGVKHSEDKKKCFSMM